MIWWLHLHPLSSQYILDRHTGRLRKRDNLLTGEEEVGGGVEPNHMTAKKPDPLQIIQYSLV
jgi:hypothetical protein